MSSYARYATGYFANGGFLVGAGGIDFTAAGTLVNAGVVGGTIGVGVRLSAGGKIVNSAGAFIYGQTEAIYAAARAGIYNSGYVSGNGTMGVAIVLQSGGLVHNDATGDIEARSEGVFIRNGSAQVINEGAIRSATYAGVYVYHTHGSVTNTSSGYILGGSGISIGAIGATIVNAGKIAGSRFAAVGLYNDGGSTIINSAGGTITGYTDGVRAFNSGSDLIRNSGLIQGRHDSGIYSATPGRVARITNFAGGTITGHLHGVYLRTGTAAIVNSGSIGGATGNGIYLKAGGSLSNGPRGSISGASVGVLVSGSDVTVTNAGTISGGSFAVDFIGGGAHTLIVDPGAVFAGVVNGPASTLVLASSASVGAIAGFGTAFKGFNAVDVDAGSKWTLGGTNNLGPNTSLSVAGSFSVTGRLASSGPVAVANQGTLRTTGVGFVQVRGGLTLHAGATILDSSTGTFEIGSKGGATKGVVTVDGGASLTGAGTIGSPAVDAGVITATGGTLAFTGSLSGAGALNISSHASVTISGALAVSRLAFLAGGSETAVFGAPTKVTSTISGFRVASNLIDLRSFVTGSASFSGHTLTLNRAGGSAAHLLFAGTYTINQFAITSDTHGGTNVRFV